MSTARLTRIERMPQERQEFIDSLLRKRDRPSGAEVAALYNAKYPPALTGEDDLDGSTVCSYRQRRLDKELQAIKKQKQEYVARIQAISETGLDEATQALIWEKLQEDNLSGAQLILLRSVETKRKELDVKNREQDRKLKEFELKEKEWNARQQAAREATDEAEAKIASGQPVTVDDIKRLRERVIGAAPTAAVSH